MTGENIVFETSLSAGAQTFKFQYEFDYGNILSNSKIEEKNQRVRIKSSGAIYHHPSTTKSYLNICIVVTIILIYQEFLTYESKMGMKRTFSSASNFIALLMFLVFISKPVIHGASLMVFSKSTAIHNFGVGEGVLNKFMTGAIIYPIFL